VTTTDRRLVIVNPTAGSGRTKRRWQGIVDQLRDAIDVELHLTQSALDATDAARDWVADGGREIVVLGGDGTVHEVATGCVIDAAGNVAAADVTLSVIHQGTGGDLCRTLGIPRNAREAVAVATTGTAQLIDLGIVTATAADGSSQTRAFHTCVNVGVGADVVARTTGPLKRLGDSAGFAVASVASLARNRRRSVSLSIDGDPPVTMGVTEVMACNGRYVGGGMLAAPNSDPTDGQLDVMIVGRATRRQLLGTFPKIYRGTHVEHPLVRIDRVRTLCADPVGDDVEPVSVDGELLGTVPARISVLAGAIRVRVPS
jgi:YegS/Rv2252/BmrU family lipid kinase